jgi:hypothetical protein
MQAQYLLIFALFAAALFFIVRRFWTAFFGKSESACPKGCGGGCSTIDVDRLQRTIEAQAARQ